MCVRFLSTHNRRKADGRKEPSRGGKRTAPVGFFQLTGRRQVRLSFMVAACRSGTHVWKGFQERDNALLSGRLI